MSTRVDKGGPKFKPILKTKGRPPATPAPHVRTRPSAEPGISMPPPASLPERTPSVVPTPSVIYASPITSSSSAVPQPGPPVPSPITLNQPSRPLRSGTAIAATRPYTLRVEHTHPSLSDPIVVQPTTAPVAEPGTSCPDSLLPSSTVIREPSRSTSGQPVAGPSRGVPITVFRPSPAPSVTSIPSTSNGKRRAGPETTESGQANNGRSDSHQNANSFEERGSVAQKRPKLSILQAEEDRVNRRPSRHSKSADTGVETETDGDAAEQSASEAAGSKRSKRPRKKTVDENAAEATAEEGQQREMRRHANRKKKQTQDAETPVNAEASDLPSESSVSPKKRRRRGATVEVAEPEGTSEPIDPTQIRMSAICDDPGSGRVSSRWESSQIQYADARRRAKEERARALAEADEEERETGRTGAKKGAPKPVLPGGEDTANAAGEESVMENTGQNPDDFTYTETLKTSHYAPQVRIGANGEVVLDMDSLQVDRAADPELGEEPYSHIEESDQSKFTNNSSWSKRRVVRWGKEDTALFYGALRQFGQNFDLIARVLPGRTYRMCKNKFKAEDKKHPALIDDALRNSIAVDLGTLSRMTGKDFTGPTPVIEAKKTLNLREDASAGTGLPDIGGPNAPDTRFSDIDDGISVPVENVSSVPTARQSTSPPPPNTYLSSIVETRRSASPPPPSSLLEAIRAPESSSGALQESGATLPRSISIAAPVRTPVAISLSTRSGMQTAVKATTAVTSGPPVEVGAQPSETSAKGQGESQAVHEDDVEILGLADEIDQYFPD